MENKQQYRQKVLSAINCFADELGLEDGATVLFDHQCPSEMAALAVFAWIKDFPNTPNGEIVKKELDFLWKNEKLSWT
jgi:hypothetical protein